MKSSLQCPKCNKRKVLRVNEVLDKAPGAGGGKLSILGAVKDDGVALGEWENVGVFEVYVCATCGYAEWFVRDPEALPVDGKKVELMEVSSGEGPYR